MAFRVLSESEVNTLSERQKKLYLEELELYQERCAFVDRIEELENVHYPEIRPKYVFLSRIEPDKIDGVINVEESQIVLENVFLPEMLDEKDDVKKMEKMTLELSKAYQIEKNNGIIIPKTIEEKYDAPENREVVLPEIEMENLESESEYNFDEVEISDISGVLTKAHIYEKEIQFEEVDVSEFSEEIIKADIYVNEMKFENIEIKNDVYINTSHPEVNFNAEEVSGYDINLNINDDYVSPDILEYDEAEVEIQNTTIFIPKNEQVEMELMDEIVVKNENILIAKASKIDYKNDENIKVSEINKTVIAAPNIEINITDDNQVELADVKIVETQEIKEIIVDASDISIDEPVVAMASIENEFIFKQDSVDNGINVNTVIPVAQSIDFVKPELVLNDNKVYIESPIIIDEKASEKIQQIINSMGDNHEE